VETLDGARELDKEHLPPVWRSVGGINFALQPAEGDVCPRTSSDVQDQWAADAGPIAVRHETPFA
jgi:hypothetical protein